MDKSKRKISFDSVAAFEKNSKKYWISKTHFSPTFV